MERVPTIYKGIPISTRFRPFPHPQKLQTVSSSSRISKTNFEWHNQVPSITPIVRLVASCEGAMSWLWKNTTQKTQREKKNLETPYLYHWLCEKELACHTARLSLCNIYGLWSESTVLNHDSYCRVPVACLMIQSEVEYCSPLLWYDMFGHARKCRIIHLSYS